MPLESILFMTLLYAYIPVQIILLVAGVLLVMKWNKRWGRMILGIICLMAFALMLPFTRLMAGLAYLMITGQGFGA